MKRIHIGTDYVAVSKPGYDVEAPPAVDYKYMALDSRLPKVVSPLEIGLIPAISVNLIVPFTTTYPGIPGVEIVTYVGNTYITGLVIRDQGSVIYNRTPFYLGVWPHQFQIVDDTQYVRWSGLTSGRPAFYIAWQTW